MWEGTVHCVTNEFAFMKLNFGPIYYYTIKLYYQLFPNIKGSVSISSILYPLHQNKQLTVRAVPMQVLIINDKVEL